MAEQGNTKECEKYVFEKYLNPINLSENKY